jgi:hypothetical protein
MTMATGIKTVAVDIKPQAGVEIRGNFVLLTADTLHLLLPQHEVGAVQYLDGELETAEQAGLLKRRGTESSSRFAALSPQMTLLPDCPPGRFLAATLGDGSDGLGWCWSDLKCLVDVELHPKAIPAVLLAHDAPVKQYVELDGKLAFLCNAQQVCAFALALGN